MSKRKSWRRRERNVKCTRGYAETLFTKLETPNLLATLKLLLFKFVANKYALEAWKTWAKKSLRLKLSQGKNSVCRPYSSLQPLAKKKCNFCKSREKFMFACLKPGNLHLLERGWERESFCKWPPLITASCFLFFFLKLLAKFTNSQILTHALAFLSTLNVFSLFSCSLYIADLHCMISPTSCCFLVLFAWFILNYGGGWDHSLTLLHCVIREILPSSRRAKIHKTLWSFKVTHYVPTSCT